MDYLYLFLYLGTREEIFNEVEEMKTLTMDRLTLMISIWDEANIVDDDEDDASIDLSKNLLTL